MGITVYGAFHINCLLIYWTIHLYMTVPWYLNPQHRAQGQREHFMRPLNQNVVGFHSFRHRTLHRPCGVIVTVQGILYVQKILGHGCANLSCRHRCHCVNPAKLVIFILTGIECGIGTTCTDTRDGCWSRSKKRVLSGKLFSKLTDKPGARTRGKPVAAACFSKRRFKIKI